MSMKLFNKSLEILNDDNRSASKQEKATQNTTWTKQKQQNKFKSGISAKVHKNMKHPEQIAANGNKIKHKRQTKSNIEEEKKARLEQNMRRLLVLSRNTIQQKDAEKIIKRAHKKDIVQLEQAPVEAQESIFTEEDFAAFEREYFG